MKSASPVEMALRGIPSNVAESTSCTITRPPASFTARTPRMPSLPVPDSTIATERSPWSSASERRKKSIGRFTPRGESISESCSFPSWMDRFLLGGMR